MAATNQFDRDVIQLQRLGEGFGTLFRVMDAGLSGLQRHVARFVELTNPAALIQFNLAVRDMQAVIGQMMVPILNHAKQVIRAFADQLVNLSPFAKAGIAAFGALAVSLTVAAAASMVLSTVLNLFTGGLGGLIPKLIGVVAAFLLMGEGGKALQGFMTAFGQVMEAVGTVITAALKPILSIVTTLMPVIMGAVKAVVGIIAMALTPVIAVVQVFAEVFKALEPVFTFVGQILSSLGDWFRVFGEVLGRLVVGILTPFIVLVKLFGAALQALQPVLNQVVGLINQFVRAVAKFFGVVIDDDMSKSSVNAAVRNVELGNIESFVSEQQKRSFAGGTQQQDVPSKLDGVNKHLAKIEGWVKDIVDWVTNAKDSLEEFGDGLIEGITLGIGNNDSAPPGWKGDGVFGAIAGTIVDTVTGARDRMDKMP